MEIRELLRNMSKASAKVQDQQYELDFADSNMEIGEVERAREHLERAWREYEAAFIRAVRMAVLKRDEQE